MSPLPGALGDLRCRHAGTPEARRAGATESRGGKLTSSHHRQANIVPTWRQQQEHLGSRSINHSITVSRMYNINITQKSKTKFRSRG
eukprot:scaffold8701_cov120-Isochrysis_galbana.AAC.4